MSHLTAPPPPRRPSNYDVTRERMETVFLAYNQEKMIEKFHLPHTPEYLYISFVGRTYRIDRKTGKVAWQSPDTDRYLPAGFNDSMTLFDVLCYAKDDCRLSGEYVPANEVDGIRQAAAKPSGGMFPGAAAFFTHRCDDLRKSCATLGGVPLDVGDVSYCLPLFTFLPVVLQFWDADDEFEAVLKIMWDRRVIDFMHYETIFYASRYLLDRLKECAE